MIQPYQLVIANVEHDDRAARNCTCHPDEAPIPCQHKYAFSECAEAARAAAPANETVKG